MPTDVSPTSASPVRLLFWRVAALTTDMALRNRESLVSAWPILRLFLAGLMAYALGRLFGGWALTALP